MIKNKKRGFTLVEVLTALLIIGIIAVLTLPSLINGLQAKARMELLKNTVASVENAIQQEMTRCRTTNVMDTDIYKDPITFLKKFDIATSGSPFASGYSKYSGGNVSVSIPSNGRSWQAAVLLKNGVGIGIIIDSAISIVVDLNGATKPNVVGADYFVLKIDTNSENGIFAGDITSFVVTDSYTGALTSPELKSACKSGDGKACFNLVLLSDYAPDYLK